MDALPTDLLALVLTVLPPIDVVRASQASRALREAASVATHGALAALARAGLDPYVHNRELRVPFHLSFKELTQLKMHTGWGVHVRDALPKVLDFVGGWAALASRLIPVKSGAALAAAPLEERRARAFHGRLEALVEPVRVRLRALLSAESETVVETTARTLASHLDFRNLMVFSKPANVYFAETLRLNLAASGGFTTKKQLVAEVADLMARSIAANQRRNAWEPRVSEHIRRANGANRQDAWGKLGSAVMDVEYSKAPLSQIDVVGAEAVRELAEAAAEAQTLSVCEYASLVGST
jgi:hypothetical protein